MRLIPLTISVSFLFLAVKITDVARGTEALSEALFVSRVQAQSAQAADAAAPAEKPPVTTADDKANETIKEEKSEKKEGENPNVKESAGEVAERTFSKVELELLQNLGKRREELERWETNIQVKEAALDATEKRINDKIAQIEAMRKEVSELLAEYNAKEDAKIKSLVRIYENMKPRDAARIFDEIDMPVLLMVIDKMAEKKAAPILAEMSPQKAKQVTVQLAAERQINNAKFNTISAQPSAN